MELQQTIAPDLACLSFLQLWHLLAVTTPHRTTARKRSGGSPSLLLLLPLAETAKENPQHALKNVQEKGRL